MSRRRSRRSRQEPVWPIILVLAVVGGGLGIGALFFGEPGSGDAGELLNPSSTDDAGIPTPGDRIRVEVLNGGGVRGAAAEATDVLRGEGFDVVYFGNALAFDGGGTVVLDRTGKGGVADAVASSLGAAEVRSEPDSTRLVDVTVLVGDDWPLQVGSGALGDSATFEDAEPVGEGASWWDVGRFFDGAR